MTTSEIITEPGRTRWRWVPLASGVALWIVTFLTFGAGVVLAPLGLVLTAVAARRIGSPKGAAFWCGVVLTAWMGILFLITVAIFLNDELVAG
jgi:hypothetical protein